LNDYKANVYASFFVLYGSYRIIIERNTSSNTNSSTGGGNAAGTAQCMTAAQQQLVTEACLLLSVLLEGDLSSSGAYNSVH
jgi:hypothetical protein